MSETQSHVIYVTSAEAVGHVDSRASAAAAAKSTFFVGNVPDSSVHQHVHCRATRPATLRKPFRGICELQLHWTILLRSSLCHKCGRFIRQKRSRKHNVRPTAWNALPNDLRAVNDSGLFKKPLKAHFLVWLSVFADNTDYYYFMHLVMLHKSFEKRTNRGSGRSHMMQFVNDRS